MAFPFDPFHFHHPFTSTILGSSLNICSSSLANQGGSRVKAESPVTYNGHLVSHSTASLTREMSVDYLDKRGLSLFCFLTIVQILILVQIKATSGCFCLSLVHRSTLQIVSDSKPIPWNEARVEKQIYPTRHGTKGCVGDDSFPNPFSRFNHDWFLPSLILSASLSMVRHQHSSSLIVSICACRSPIPFTFTFASSSFDSIGFGALEVMGNGDG